MFSEKLKLDDVDRQIITLVQEDPHITHTQIAEKINRSQPTVGMRIKKLEKVNPGLAHKFDTNHIDIDHYLAFMEFVGDQSMVNAITKTDYVVGYDDFILNCWGGIVNKADVVRITNEMKNG